MARGKDRQDICLDDADSQTFIDSLGRVAQRSDWTVWTWCLMGSHYHLLIKTRQQTLAKSMREVNGIYTRQTRYRAVQEAYPTSA